MKVALQHLVHDAIRLQRLDCHRRMLSFPANMCIHPQYVMPLNMRMIRHLKAQVELSLKPQGMLIKHREGNAPLTANQLDTILAAIRDKVPAAHPQCSRSKAPAGGHRVFRRITPRLASRETGHLDNIPGQVLEQVEAMTGQVSKVSASGHHWVRTPVASMVQVR